MTDPMTQMLAALRLAKLSLLVCAVAGGWISGLSYAKDEPIRVVLGLVVALLAAAALYRLSDLRVHR